MTSLTPGQSAVLEIIRRYDGACRRDFANHDWYNPNARIYELKRLGYRFVMVPCKKHRHPRGMKKRVLLASPKEGR